MQKRLSKRMVKRTQAFVVGMFLTAACGSALAERLPVKTYTTADGLLRDEVNRIKQDSRGFLWFCTNDGLSRFDGYGFTNYTTDDGLPHRVVNDMLETRDGVIWIATSNGLTRFNPKGQRAPSVSVGNWQSAIGNAKEPMFVRYVPEDTDYRKYVTVLFEDAQGKLWCGTGDGLYQFEERDGNVAFHPVDLPKQRPDFHSEVSAIIQDRQGNLWVAAVEQGLNRITPDGRIEHYATRREHSESESIITLFETREGQIWAGMSQNGGLCSLVSEPDPNRPIFSRCYAQKDGLPSNWVFTLYQTSDEKLWIGTTNGIASVDPASSTPPQFRVYREAQGLCDKEAFTFREDRDGNLWAATTCGVKKIVRSSFVRYSEDDGLAPQHVNSIFVSHSGELFVITNQAVESEDKKRLRSIHLINRFDGNRFTSVRTNMPTSVDTGWGGGQIVLQDKAGDWWLPSNKRAAFRFPKVKRLEHLSSVRPQGVAIPDQEVFRLYEDSHGDIWITTMYQKWLLKWERSTETIHNYENEIQSSGASCFAEDKYANLWIGFSYDDKLARYKDGRFTVLPTNGEKSGGGISSLYFDHAGRLWLASSLNGVGRIDDPNADELKIVWYSRRKGLATDSTLSLTEDNFGRIYVGHAIGVDRIDPNTDQIKHYTAADGLPQGMIHFAGRDRQGSLWFGWRGLARLIPERDKSRQAPNIFLTGLRVAGEKQSISELGEEVLSELTLDASQRQVSVDFLGLGASLGEELKYQYRLEGAQTDWSEPTTQRTVDFANLSPGTYRLSVKAITAEGTESIKPAVFAFTILPPIWQRWWFLSLTAIVVGLTAYALFRYRVARLIELERVRTRIATDLHDDIGANLSLIAMAGEVVRMQSRKDDAQTRESLSLISETSRELVDAMGDIVWAVNPSKDHLSDLTKKMRRFASDVFSARNIALRFQAPGDEHDIKLGTDTRREVFLIFKESVNNIARHSKCTEADIDLQARAGWLVLKLSDNGKGFDVAEASDGSGLASLRQRATRLGAGLEIISANGKGTTVTLQVPLGRRSRK